jgi:hypothetical protein
LLKKEDMEELALSNCVRQDGKIYCVKDGKKVVVITIEEIPLKECPRCLLEALAAKQLEEQR